MAIKLEVKNLYKVFGEHPQRAFKYIEKGLSKEQILEKRGYRLALKTPVWPLKKARFLSSWDYPVRVNPLWFAFSIA
jgi:glycine betaine/proline transport system ATP-binding protein